MSGAGLAVEQLLRNYVLNLVPKYIATKARRLTIQKAPEELPAWNWSLHCKGLNHPYLRVLGSKFEAY